MSDSSSFTDYNTSAYTWLSYCRFSLLRVICSMVCKVLATQKTYFCGRHVDMQERLTKQRESRSTFCWSLTGTPTSQRILALRFLYAQRAGKVYAIKGWCYCARCIRGLVVIDVMLETLPVIRMVQMFLAFSVYLINLELTLRWAINIQTAMASSGRDNNKRISPISSYHEISYNVLILED